MHRHETGQLCCLENFLFPPLMKYCRTSALDVWYLENFIRESLLLHMKAMWELVLQNFTYVQRSGGQELTRTLRSMYRQWILTCWETGSTGTDDTIRAATKKMAVGANANRRVLAGCRGLLHLILWSWDYYLYHHCEENDHLVGENICKIRQSSENRQWSPVQLSQDFKAFMEENGIRHNRTTLLWAQANGEVERHAESIPSSLPM